MQTPPRLQAGDRVALIATGRKVSEENMEAALRVLTAWGLKVVLGKNLFSNAHSYLAGTDAERLADLQTALDDPGIRAIFCARGGYGNGRIIDDADYTALQHSPKWIAGFSDVTALHLQLLQQGIQSLHSTMPILFGHPAGASSVESLKQALFASTDTIVCAESTFNRTGYATGCMVGGNLSLIADSLGTATELDTDGKILVIEEIGEKVYRVDRMINQLKRAGKLDRLAGLVVGHMTDINEDTPLPFGETATQIVLHHTRTYTYPVAFGFPSGHEHPNLAWIQGGQASLDVTGPQAIITPA